MHVHGPPLGHLQDESAPSSPWQIGPTHGAGDETRQAHRAGSTRTKRSASSRTPSDSTPSSRDLPPSRGSESEG